VAVSGLSVEALGGEPSPARPGAGRTASDGTGPDFWAEVGATFPSLKGARSTAHYRAAEERLLARFFPPLAGQRLVKTDLWDEAKRTLKSCAGRPSGERGPSGSTSPRPSCERLARSWEGIGRRS
jgi:hypothetical protein